jgi:peptide/nickel transport system permease protein
VVSRIAQALFVVWAAATLAFVLLRLAPGDPYVTRFDGFNVPEAQRAVWRANRGYDASMAEQYVRYLRNTARGDLGFSTMQQRPVRDVLRDVLPNTLLLMGLALGTSVLFGMAIGSWQGTRSDSTADQLVSTASLVAYSMPEFWLALLLMQLFALKLGWFPVSGATAAMHEYMSSGFSVAHYVIPGTSRLSAPHAPRAWLNRPYANMPGVRRSAP